MRQVGYLQGYFLLFLCALFKEFPRFSRSGDVGLHTAEYCFIYVLHCWYLSQCRIWNYRCIALGAYHNRESEITTVLHYVSFLPLFSYVLTYGIPVRLHVKHSANCAVASHSRWCPSCCFVWIPLHSAPLPCCVFYSITFTVTTPAELLPKSQAKVQIYHLYPPSGILRLDVYRIFCIRGSANILSLACPNLSCPVLIISLRLPLRSTIVSFIQALSLLRISFASHF